MSIDPIRHRPTWSLALALCVVVGLVVACVVGLVAVGWQVVNLRAELRVVAGEVSTEQVYRASSRERQARLLTLLEHASCDEIQDLREAVRKMREEMTDAGTDGREDHH